MASNQHIPDEIKQEAARWIIERDAGMLTADDEKHLAAWLGADPQHAQAFTRLERSWAVLGGADLKVEVRRWKRPVPHMISVWHPRWAGGALAASLMLFVMAGAYDWPTRLQADAMTATGEQRAVPLPDGSIVQLNTGSAISVDFRKDRRLINLLKGEAAFSVAPDSTRPFTVRAGNGTTTAVGTRFIVRSTDDNTEVSVTEHSVKVALSEPIPGKLGDTIVNEGQAIRYNANGLSRRHMVDVVDAAAWTRGHMIFIDRPLTEVVAELNRYHAGYIRVLGDGLSRRRFSGVLPTGDPMGALDAIQGSLGIGSTRLTNKLIFLHS